MGISPYLPIISLNVNGLNSSFKRHREAEWIKKERERDHNMLPTRDLL